MAYATDQEYSINRKVAIVGIGETAYYRQGQSPVSEFQLACQAIMRAADDAGLSPRDIDGFVSYGNDRNDPMRLAAALGIPEYGFAGLTWGGGGQVCGAVGIAAAALQAGYCKYAVVFRALCQGQFGRFGRAGAIQHVSGQRALTSPYGLFSPAQMIALRTRRFMHDHSINQDPLAAIALTCYTHAQRNPRAVMYGRTLTREQYDNSRWIVEPFHLFDCCMENDGAAAVILTTPDRAAALKQKPAYVMAAAQGADGGFAMATQNRGPYASANFNGIARRLYEMAGVGPSDVDVAQLYENFTGGVMMALVEHGFCKPDEVMEFCTPENLQWPSGRLPLNTSGGNIAECYMHGLELVNEAVRQVRGTSTSQVDNVQVSLVAGGPATAPASSLILTN